ncbi:hypothetical protein [Microbacterium sp.]|uniref:hypothetical protein n=1 Tax=Microbacterium sp. TaxID=51671 RepID=UPI0039E6E10C
MCNVLLDTSYKPGRTRSYFTPATLRSTRGSERDLSQYKIWCPKNMAAAGAKREWTNVLSSSGEEIRERRASVADRSVGLSSIVHPALTFLRVKDQVTGERGLRFIGVFERDRVEGDTVVYRRTDTEFTLPGAASRR